MAWHKRIKELGWEAVDWIELAQDRDLWRVLVSTLMIRQCPYKTGNFLTMSGSVSFARRSLLHAVGSYDTVPFVQSA
jgi:hypothetical protein